MPPARVDRLQDAASKAQTIAILQRNTGTSREAATRSYDTLPDPVRGFTKTADLDPDGVKMVMALRSQAAILPISLDDPA